MDTSQGGSGPDNRSDDLVIEAEAAEKTTVQLTNAQGELIRAILEKHSQQHTMRLSTYCTKVGLDYGNVSNILRGRRRVSYDVLQRLFSGVALDVKCTIQISITPSSGEDANDANSVTLDEMLLLEGGDVSADEQLEEMESSSTTTEKFSGVMSQMESTSPADHLERVFETPTEPSQTPDQEEPEYRKEGFWDEITPPPSSS